jgi:hypothetical protein
MSKAILEPILEGIRSTCFFNGRLLSGEDLAREQVASRDARRGLGRAIGEGVAYGLQVVETRNVSSIDDPVVTVKAGAAINRRGEVLSLPSDTELSLLGGGTATPAVPSAFKECEPPTPSGFVVGEGAYLLVIGPTERREGRAPVSGLGNETASCNASYTIEGVRFRMVAIPRTPGDLLDPDRFRNRLAHRCFGTDTAARFAGDPFGPTVTQYGAIDQLRAGGTLTDCDVPLAAMLWTRARGGIEFIDMWAVRRRLSGRSVAPPWDLVVGDRRASEAEAMFLQFQDQVEDIAANDPNPAAIDARSRFLFLPPAGLLPIKTTTRLRGFDPQKFFGTTAWSHAATVAGNQIRPLCLEALAHEAIDLSSPERIQVYKVFDTVRRTEASFVAFASPTMRMRRRYTTGTRA